MYPTAIIVIVALQKSHLEHQFTYPTAPASEEDSLPFAVNAQNAPYTSTSTGLDKHVGGPHAQIIALHDVGRKHTTSTGTAGGEEYTAGWEEDKDVEMVRVVGLAQ